MIADDRPRTNPKRYFLTAWVQTEATNPHVFLEYRSPGNSQQMWLGNMSQNELDMAFNEMTRIDTQSAQNTDDGHYSFQDLIDFWQDYGVFQAEPSFTWPDKAVWTNNENTVEGRVGDFTFNLADGYAIELEYERSSGNTRQGSTWEKKTNIFRGEGKGNMSLNTNGRPMTLLAVQTPDEAIDPQTGDDIDDITLREREPTELRRISFDGLTDSYLILLEYPADPEATWPDNPDMFWQVEWGLGDDWEDVNSYSAEVFPRHMRRTYNTLEEAEDYYDYVKSLVESALRQDDRNTVLATAQGLMWLPDGSGNFTQEPIQGVAWRGGGIYYRYSGDEVLTQDQLEEGFGSTAHIYNWRSPGESWDGTQSYTQIADFWRDKWQAASTDEEKIAVFNEWWEGLTQERAVEELQDMTFKSLWEHHLQVDPENSIIEGDETGETPFRQFLLEDIDDGVSWITDNMLSVNKQAKRVSIVADSDYGFALRITPPEGMNIDMGGWGNLVEGWSSNIGSLVLFFEGGNGITIENGEMTIKHNRAKSVYPFSTIMRTSSWDDFILDTDGDTYPEWKDNGDRLFFPDDDANYDISNGIKITVREGWTADLDLETENMSFFTEHFKNAGEPITFENDKWTKGLEGGDYVEMDQDNEHSEIKNGFRVYSLPPGKTNKWEYGTNEAVDDEVWIGFTNIRFNKYRQNEPLTFEQAIIRAIYPYEFSLNSDAFTIELVQIYDARVEEDQAALEWGTTDPQDAPPQDDDADDDDDIDGGGGGPGEGGMEGWILGIGIVVLLVLAVRFTGGGLGE